MFGLPGVHVPGAWSDVWRVVFLGASACLLARARGWDRRALGLVWRIEPSVAFWLRVSGWMSLVIVIGFAVAIGVSRAGADPFGLCRQRVQLTAWDFQDAVIRAP